MAAGCHDKNPDKNPASSVTPFLQPWQKSRKNYIQEINNDDDYDDTTLEEIKCGSTKTGIQLKIMAWIRSKSIRIPWIGFLHII